MRTYYIYKVTNNINGKIYIGQTNNFEKRKREHILEKDDNSIFHKALRKYGAENFTWQVIDFCNSKKQIDGMERFYILKYKSFKPNGYNMTKGGDGGSMWNAKPIVCLTLDGEYVCEYDSASQAQIEYGYCNSDVLLCCKNLAKRCRNKQFMYKDDYEKYGRKKYVPKIAHNIRGVIQCDLNGKYINEFHSVYEASKQTGVHRPSISSNLSGRYKTAGGYIFVYKENYPIKDISNHFRNKKGTRVLQIDIISNEVTNEYESVAEAGRKLHKNYKAIHNVLDKEDRTAYGFKWKSKSIPR